MADEGWRFLLPYRDHWLVDYRGRMEMYASHGPTALRY